MTAREWTVEEIGAILRTTVATLEEHAAAATPADLQPTGYDDEWSLAGIVAHLRACNDVLGGAVLRILAEDHPAWRASSPRAWQAKSGFHAEAFEPSFAAFKAGRSDLLTVLESVEPAGWERTATVTVPPAKVYERSVHYYGVWLAQHEGTHLKDLARRQRTR